MFLEKAYTGINRWYFYILSLLIVFVATQIGSLPLAGYLLWRNPELLQRGGNLSSVTDTNLGLALTLLGFLVGFFALLLCVKYIHHKNYLDIVTARRQLDWGRIFFGAGLWGILSLITFALPFIFGDTSDIVFQFQPLNFVVLLLISLMLFPFQTSFEELLFRGYLMQGSALVLRYRWAAILLTGILFGVLHGANPEVKEFGVWLALPQYILMGLILGLVAVKDDGMELALGLHGANNILAAVTFTSDASTLQTHALFKDLAPSASYWDIITIVVSGILFIWICNRKYHFWNKVNIWEKIDKG